MKELIIKKLLNNSIQDSEIINYISNILDVIDYNDDEELSSLFDFISTINNNLSFDEFINIINNSNKNNNKKIIINQSLNIPKPQYTKQIKSLNIPELEPIENKKPIIEKYSLIEDKNITHNPFLKFENAKKVRYYNDRIVSTKGDKYIDI